MSKRVNLQSENIKPKYELKPLSIMNKTTLLLRKCFAIALVLALPVIANAEPIIIEASTMTTGGKYAGPISNPFNGVALYANGDYASKTVDFPDGDGVYTIKVTGASNNSSAAGVSLYINGTKIEAFSFSGTAATEKSSQKKLYLSSSQSETEQSGGVILRM